MQEKYVQNQLKRNSAKTGRTLDPLITSFDFVIFAAWTQGNLLFFLILNTNIMLEPQTPI